MNLESLIVIVECFIRLTPGLAHSYLTKLSIFYRARWTFCQSGGVSGGLWHGHVAPLPRLHPRLRRHVQQDLAGAQASNEEQGRHVEGKRSKLIIIFTLYHVRMSQELWHYDDGNNTQTERFISAQHSCASICYAMLRITLWLVKISHVAILSKQKVYFSAQINYAMLMQPDDLMSCTNFSKA